MAKRIILHSLALMLAAFFGFVGWNKAFATLSDLASYGAWTVHLPEAAGRIVGWSELACAVGLLIPRTKFCVAAALIANQIAAAAVHLAYDETAALPQNAVLVALLSVLAFFTFSQRRSV